MQSADIGEQRLQPELRLVLHVLRRAYADIWLSTGKDWGAAEDAKRWIQHEGIEPYSFRWACSVIGWDYENVRGAMLARPAERTLLYGK